MVQILMGSRRRLLRYAPVLIIVMMMSLQLAGCERVPQLTPLAAGATVLAFGDSLTYGSGADRDQSYPAQLAALTGLRVINAGVPGEISAAGLRRLPGLFDRYQPRLLILCHGGNDILRRMPAADTVDHLQAMIDIARSRNIDVILIAVPEPALWMSSANFYDELAQRNQIPIENHSLAEILASAALKSDRVHPNAQGYQQLAKAIANLLVQTGAIDLR